MTAEIAIINRQGIALAADSAVTIGRSRVWKTANKLFSLGPANDIAVMIYNTGDFVGIPWEIIVKEFRDIVGTKRFEFVIDREREFFAFLDSEVFKIGAKNDLSAFSVILNFIDDLAIGVKPKTRKEAEKIILERIPTMLSVYGAADELQDFVAYSTFHKLFGDDIKVLCKDAFGYSLTVSCIKQTSEMIFHIISRKNQSGFMSGLVFAGFGSKQLLPYMANYIVDGKFGTGNPKISPAGKTRFWLDRRCDLNGPDLGSAYVYPFAQSDMFYLFMEGIAPLHLRYLSEIFKAVLDEKAEALINNFVPNDQQVVETQLQKAENETIIAAFQEQFEDYRHESLVSPVLDVIKALPKEEMAAMAEALVELTALRRKVGSSLESVGGPTDVAVISKTEGLIWLKRKHYFTAELNADYPIRRKLRLGGENA